MIGWAPSLALLLAVGGGAPQRLDEAPARLDEALARLEHAASALDQRAAELPDAWLGAVTDDERRAAAAFADAYAAFEEVYAGGAIERARLGDLVEQLEVAWSALRDFASARQARDRRRMRDAAASLFGAAATARDVLRRDRRPDT